MVKDKTVIVSDLHIDTWNQTKQFNGKTKQQHFFAFLDWITPFTATFIINGDLFDAPPGKGKDLWPTHEEVLTRLSLLAQDTNLYYFIGNHDLGLWGLRIKKLWNLKISYPCCPELSIQTEAVTEEAYIYFEHGHNYDPALTLYIRNAVKSMVPLGFIWKFKEVMSRLKFRFFSRADARKAPSILGPDPTALQGAVLRAAQRRHPDTGEKTGPLGLSWHLDIKSVKRWLWRKVGPLIQRYYTPLNWGEAADHVFKNFCEQHPDKKIKLIVFGHTHVPDEQELVFDDEKSLYLNSGDWCEPVLKQDPETHHSSFIVLDKDGKPERDSHGEAVRDYITEVAEALHEPSKVTS